ncbi:MAG: response regulator [Roseiflexaceae bacterium]
MSNKPITVLLIEDNTGDARLIREMLSEVKSSLFELECVERLSAGLGRLAAGGIDVVLLDLSLPDSQGFETFVKLRGQDSRAPILVLTGLDDEDMAIRAMQAGAQDYLVKGPLTNRALARAIRYAIERKRVEQEQRFLAKASTLLATSLDYEITLDRVAHLAVPDLADWCAVHMLEADGTIQRLAVAHVDPAKATLARERTGRYPLDPNAPHIVPQVLRTGRSELYTEVPDSLLIASARDAEHLEILRLLGFKSYICAPLMARGRTLGAITVAVSESGRRYDEHDLALAEELAHRIAVAIDNARLYRVAQEEIAERKQVEAALRQSEERFAKAFLASPAAMSISRLSDGSFIDTNASYQRLFGYHRDELIGQSGVEVGIYTSPEQRATLVRMLHDQGAVRETDLMLHAKSGELRNVLFSAETIELGGEACILVIIIDITDRKRLEAQFHQAQKMESIGQLAGSVAHDFNNLLTVISGYAELALRTLPPVAVAREDLQEIVKTAGRAAALTRQLLTFARKQIIEPQVLKLNDLIGEIDKLLRRLIGEDIDLVTLLSTDPGQVKVDPGQIEQVLVNLAVNARDAMPNGGKLTIETHNVVLDHHYTQQHLDVIPGPYVLVAVSDTGSGMDAETQGRIFEPFFTTKGPERGTGLGLATCYGIVKQHGGHIWVYSELQQGTTFKIYLPQTDASVMARAQLDAARDLPPGVETVLLAEDEPAVRALAARALREQGYTVLEAVDGAMALRLASEYIGTTIDLLLTDAVMPHIGGKELFDQLNVFYPNIKALFISGYTDDAIVHHGRLAPGVAFLQKPFSPSALVLKVREVLDVRG